MGGEEPCDWEVPLKGKNTELEKKTVGWMWIKVSHLNKLCWRGEETWTPDHSSDRECCQEGLAESGIIRREGTDS